MEQNSVLEKIRKCLALSNSPVEAEAEAALKKAHELLRKYNLEMVDIEKETDRKIPTIEFRVKIGTREWRRALINEICLSNYCSMLLSKSDMIVAGKAHNIQAVLDMSGWLISQLENRAYLEAVGRADHLRYSNSYLQGAVSRICIRLRETRKAERQESTALVVLDNEAQEYLTSKYKMRSRQVTASPLNAEAYYKGAAVGQTIPLHPTAGQLER